MTGDRRPAVALLGAVWRGSRTGRVMLVALALGSALLLAVPVRDDAALLLMGKLQLRGPFLRWAALQPLPSMYNFSNVVRFDPPPAGAAGDTIWLNHYPLRAITYVRRIEMAERPAALTVETRFGDLSVVTRCRTQPRDGVTEVTCEVVR